MSVEKLTPNLSILICSIPSRFEKARALYEHILAMVGDKNIEVLLFMDNKKRTIGEKREGIASLANGMYVMFVDDDDSLYSIDEVYEASKGRYDVITFKSKCLNSDGSEFIVTFGLGNEVEHNTKDGRYLDCKRPPFPQCAWWRYYYHQFHFPDINYGEDWEWTKRVIKYATKEFHIDKVIHGYNFSPAISEASTETNAFWKNPNIEPVKRCIVNLVTNEHYRKGQDRLLVDLVKYYTEAIFTFQSEMQILAPKHEENPYAFKIYAIEHVRKLGYNQVLWLDASVYPVKDIMPVFDWLTEKGIFLEEAGHYCGTWAPQYVLDYFKVTKDEAMKMPMFSAGFCGFDFRNPISVEFFAEWKEAMLNGMFKGDWETSRHDMTAGSIIANKRGLLPLYSSGGQFFAYIGNGYGKPKDSVVFHLQGIT
jgi:hypothetical protein